MNFNLAFDRTLKEFRISAKKLAEQSGVAPQTISDFRRGKKSIQTDSLGKLLGALPADASAYFFSALLGSSLAPENFIAAMDNKELSGFVIAVGRRLQGDRLNSYKKPNASETCEAMVGVDGALLSPGAIGA